MNNTYCLPEMTPWNVGTFCEHLNHVVQFAEVLRPRAAFILRNYWYPGILAPRYILDSLPYQIGNGTLIWAAQHESDGDYEDFAMPIEWFSMSDSDCIAAINTRKAEEQRAAAERETARRAQKAVSAAEDRRRQYLKLKKEFEP